LPSPLRSSVLDTMLSFGTNGKELFSTQELEYQRPPLDSRQVVELRKLFDFLEEGKVGVLTHQKLHKVFRKLGFMIKMERVQEILKKFKGSMKFSDFLVMVSERTKEFKGADTMTHAFKVMDHNRDGLVEVSRFKSVYEVLLPSSSRDEPIRILRKIFNPEKKYNGMMKTTLAPGDPGLNLAGTPCKVISVSGQAKRAGILPGWIITKCDRKQVENEKEVVSIIKHLSKSGSHFTIELAFERVMSFREFCKYGQLTYEDFVSVMRTFST